MYPKWLAKWDLFWHGESGIFRPIYVWKSGERLSSHTEGTYRIFGVAELHGEEFHALCMRVLQEFGERFDSVLTVPHHSFFDITKMNPLLKEPRPECAMLVEERTVSVLMRGAHREVLDRLGCDFKTWKKNQWVWSSLAVEFFPKGVLPDDSNAALAEWNEHHPKTVFELKCEIYEFQTIYRDVRCVTACCIYIAPSVASADRALEGWLASGLEERGVPTEWYVTGTRPDCVDQIFR